MDFCTLTDGHRYEQEHHHCLSATNVLILMGKYGIDEHNRHEVTILTDIT